MDTIQDNVEDLVGHLTDYVETQKELFLINAQEKAASAVTQTIIWVVAGVCFIIGFGFLSTALAMWLGRLLHNTSHGFLIVGGVYVLAAGLFLIFRKSLLENRLNDLFLIKFTQNNEQ